MKLQVLFISIFCFYQLCAMGVLDTRNSFISEWLLLQGLMQNVGQREEIAEIAFHAGLFVAARAGRLETEVRRLKANRVHESRKCQEACEMIVDAISDLRKWINRVGLSADDIFSQIRFTDEKSI